MTRTISASGTAAAFGAVGARSVCVVMATNCLAARWPARLLAFLSVVLPAAARPASGAVGGTETVPGLAMTRRLLFSIAASAALAGVACDTAPRNQIGLVGPVVVTDTTFGTTRSLFISPSFVQVDAGSLIQLSTNAGNFSSALIWESRNPQIATVSQTGLVTTFLPGTATITVHFVSDPLNLAIATIVVAPFGNP